MIKTYDVNARGWATVMTKKGAKVLAVVGGTSNWRAPSIVLLEPDEAPPEKRIYNVWASSIQAPPEMGSYVGSVRTGEYEVSHVYEAIE